MLRELILNNVGWNVLSLGLPVDRVGSGAELVSGPAIAELAALYERLGFHAAYVTDHPAPDDRWLAGGGHHALEPTVALASAIDATSRARLGNPSHDFYRTFGHLVEYHLAAGHQVLLSVTAERYASLVDAGLERLYRVREIVDAGVPLFEILPIENDFYRFYRLTP